MVSGVSQVFVYGSQKYAVRVQVNPDALAARNIGIDDVMRAVQQSNVNLPTGKLYGPKQSFTVQSSGQLTNAAAYKSIIVAYRDNNPVRLEDVAQVLDSVETDKSVAWINDTRGVILAIRRQPGPTPWRWSEASRRCCRISVWRFLPRSICPSSTTPRCPLTIPSMTSS